MAQRKFIAQLARQLVDDEGVAEDVVQSTYLEVFARPPRHSDNLRAWLAGVVRNCARQFYRGEKRRQRREVEKATGSAGMEVPSTADLAAELQLHRMVIDAIDHLSEPHKSVVMLRYFHDLPPREIARRKAVPVATVNSQLARAIHRLRERLDTGARRRSASLVHGAGVEPGVEEVCAPRGAGVFTMKMKVCATIGVAAVLGLWAADRWSGDDVRGSKTAEKPAAVDEKSTDREVEEVQSGAAIVREPIDGVKSPGDRRDDFHISNVPRPGPRSDCRPIAGVTLVWSSDSKRRTQSGVDGYFRLPVPAAKGRVHVEDDELTTLLAAHVGPRVLANDRPPLVVAAPKLDFAGIVVDAADERSPRSISCSGCPTSFRAPVRAVARREHTVARQTRSDAAGRFSLAVLAGVPGSSVSVHKSGYLTRRLSVSSSETRIVMTKPEPSRVICRVKCSIATVLPRPGRAWAWVGPTL